MSEMKKIRMGEASFNYSPETAYEKNGNVYCNTCHEQINGEVVNMMGTWMCFRIQCQCEKEEEKRWKERERIMRVNQLKDTWNGNKNLDSFLKFVFQKFYRT